MKTFIIKACVLAFLAWNSACTDRDILESKPGLSLPTVTNLAMEQTGEQHLRLTWDIPAGIPEGISQPVSVVIQVTEIVSPTRSVPVFNTTLPDAPTEFSYEIPDASKTYHLTVKLYGKTKNTDVNYSSNIYSEGQTVVFTP